MLLALFCTCSLGYWTRGDLRVTGEVISQITVRTIRHTGKTGAETADTDKQQDSKRVCSLSPAVYCQ